MGELSSRGDSHHSSHGDTPASCSLDSSLPPSGVAARPQRRTAAAEPTLLTFASSTDDVWGTGPDVVVEEVIMEGGEEQDEGDGDWGDRAHTPPIEESSEKVISIFKEVFQRAYSSGCYKAQVVEQPAIPMGSLSTGKRSAKSEFLPAYPPVEYWFKLAESMSNLKP